MVSCCSLSLSLSLSQKNQNGLLLFFLLNNCRSHVAYIREEKEIIIFPPARPHSPMRPMKPRRNRVLARKILLRETRFRVSQSFFRVASALPSLLLFLLRQKRVKVLSRRVLLGVKKVQKFILSILYRKIGEERERNQLPKSLLSSKKSCDQNCSFFLFSFRRRRRQNKKRKDITLKNHQSTRTHQQQNVKKGREEG